MPPDDSSPQLNIDRVRTLRGEVDAKVRRQSYLFSAVAVSLLVIWINMLPLHQTATEAASKAWAYLGSWRTYAEYQQELERVAQARVSARNQIHALETQRKKFKIGSSELG